MFVAEPGLDPTSSYRVLGRISKGGMGDILLAERRGFNGVTDQVVLKRLSPELQEEPYVSMFLSEAQVMSRLDHPNVVRLIDLPTVQGARCIALELVRGTNLYQLMRCARAVHETVPVDLAVYIGLEVLAGLAYAHAATVDGMHIHLVHRDVKPGNVLLSRAGDVKLTDFGISKSDLSLSTTALGVVKGTPHYLSPEQVKGEGSSPCSDLFSLAVVLTELISGCWLFKREALSATLLAVSTGDRVLIADLLPRRHRALAAVLERALAVDPTQRFESAAAMASAIAGACPIDDSQAKQALAKRVVAIVDESADPLLGGGPRTRRMNSTGAVPLVPTDFGADVPVPELGSAPDPEALKGRITERDRPTMLPPLSRSRSAEKRLIFLLGFLIGVLAMTALQVALRLVWLPW